ncbi:MAG: redoxin family protein [Candidatus Cloacimonetes bacterium]|nr:redoxin family protein [Candidatus Cloacimonadota bacterium]
MDFRLIVLCFLFCIQSTTFSATRFLAPELRVSQWFDKDCKKSNFSVIDNRGKYIILFAWQSWCPGCHSSGFPALKKLTDEFKNSKKITFASIQTVFEGHSSNTVDEVCSTMNKFGIDVVAGHDPGDRSSNYRSTMMADYGTGGTPWFTIINPKGIVVYNDFHLNATEAIKVLKGELSKVK